MALLGQFHHIEIKAAFTLKTNLMVLGLLLDLLPTLRYYVRLKCTQNVTFFEVFQLFLIIHVDVILQFSLS